MIWFIFWFGDPKKIFAKFCYVHGAHSKIVWYYVPTWSCRFGDTDPDVLDIVEYLIFQPYVCATAVQWIWNQQFVQFSNVCRALLQFLRHWQSLQFCFDSVQDLFIAGGSKNSSENFSISIEYNINTIHKHAWVF